MIPSLQGVETRPRDSRSGKVDFSTFSVGQQKTLTDAARLVSTFVVSRDRELPKWKPGARHQSAPRSALRHHPDLLEWKPGARHRWVVPRVPWCGIGGQVRVPWYHGAMVPWYHSTMVPWYQGTIVPKYHGAIVMVPWHHGTMVPWYHGTSMVPW